MQGPICSSITELSLCCILLSLTIPSPVRGQENQEVAELMEVAHWGWTQAAPSVSQALVQVGNYIDSHFGKEAVAKVLTYLVAGLTFLVVEHTGISGIITFLISIFAFVGR